SLVFGIYNLTIVLTDDLGNQASDTVLVYVLPSTFTPTASLFLVDTLAIISIGITLGGVVLIVVLVRLKRLY
ncbi:MAG: hypothetical protein ACXAC0_08130, partial [Candidatus Thorarchaeota archaeon]